MHWWSLRRTPPKPPRPDKESMAADEERETAWRDALKRLEERENRLRLDLAEMTMPRSTKETTP